MQVVVTGATGMIGKPLCAALLDAGHIVTVLSRDAARAQAAIGREVQSLAWGNGASDAWKQAVSDADVAINLAGASVGEHRWTPEYKAVLRDSRIETTRALVDAMQASEKRERTLVSASAIGYYGDRQDEVLTEESPPGSDFLATLCIEWEAEARKAAAFGTRVVTIRTGVVLGEGGALEKMLHPLPLPLSPWKLGLGGPMGSGKQWLSWIHSADEIGLLFWAATNAQVQGAVNATAPDPVTNAEFARAIGRVYHRPAILPVPAFALKAALGEFADSLLGGQRVLPTVAQRLGYTFQYTTLDAALHSLLT